MATVVGTGQVKLNNGQTIAAKQGEWYDAQQYWGGTLSAAGTINSQSNQPGAGKAVSNEVIAQTNPANVAFVQQSRQMSSPSDVTTYLNDYQNGLYHGNGVQSADEILAGFKANGTLPSTPPPTPPSLAQEFSTLSTDKGLPALEGNIGALKKQIADVQGQNIINTTAESGKPVAQNVIQGRQTQEQKNTQAQLDSLNLQLGVQVDQYNAALQNVQMIMQFDQQDYANASQSYNDRYSQALQTIQLVHGIQEDQLSDQMKLQDSARANLQIMINSITKGNLSYGSLPPDQRAQINKLEVQSGLPVGFTASLQMDPGANIITTSSNNGQIQVLLRNPDGTIGLQTYGSKNTNTTQALTANENSLKNDVAAKMTLASVMKKYGNSISPDTILSTYNDYSPFGQAKESLATLQKKFNVSAPSSSGKLSAQDQANVKQIKADISNGDYTRDQAAQSFPEYANFL